ncbi:uncharacterized protein LOC117123264 [Anneissia japonica]|uniref:uncharacterized protein LOC117123264 n=1 Tax=Anneissia japonica TaxID=1529436 RepID=UPI0014257F5F|nr:uncharacterized protein LOC117123264 [Anneissia japonica]
MTNKSRTKKINRPAGKFTEDDMLMKVKDYVTSAFKLLVEDPVYSNKRYPIPIEFETRKHLTVNLLSSMSEIDYLDVMFQKVVENKIIQAYWCKLTRESLGDNASKQLLDINIKYWIKIRANAFLKVYSNLKKESGKLSKKGEKSLRKELNT